MSTVRDITGQVATNRIQDPEARRVVEALLFQIQWMLDNWPKLPKLFDYPHSVRNYGGQIQLVGDEAPQKIRRFYGHDKYGRLGFHVIADEPTYEKSVLRDGNVVTFVNDEQDPDYGQFYGVDVDAEKGWVYPREHPFRFQQTSDTGGEITVGTVMFEGAILTISSWPTNNLIENVTTTTCYYITLDVSAGTASWGSAASFPAGTATAMVFRILKIICQDDVITGIEQHRWSDICVDTGEGFAPEDPVDPGVYVKQIEDIVDADIAETWQVGDVDGVGNRLGLEHTKHTVPIYSETDHKWYSYTRVFTYAIDGRLFKMTAATKRTVHEPVAHSTL